MPGCLVWQERTLGCNSLRTLILGSVFLKCGAVFYDQEKHRQSSSKSNRNLHDPKKTTFCFSSSWGWGNCTSQLWTGFTIERVVLIWPAVDGHDSHIVRDKERGVWVLGQACYLRGTKSKKEKEHLFENEILIKNSDSADFGKMIYPLWTVAPGETE